MNKILIIVLFFNITTYSSTLYKIIDGSKLNLEKRTNINKYVEKSKISEFQYIEINYEYLGLDSILLEFGNKFNDSIFAKYKSSDSIDNFIKYNYKLIGNEGAFTIYHFLKSNNIYTSFQLGNKLCNITSIGRTQILYFSIPGDEKCGNELQSKLNDEVEKSVKNSAEKLLSSGYTECDVRLLIPYQDEVVSLMSGKENVNVMQVKMLEKIEELTLYMIELKKENEKLKTKISQIEGERK